MPPAYPDQNVYNTWKDEGSPTTEQLANKKLEKILDYHQPAPLAEEVKQHLDLILSAAEARESQS
jgi:trimethylamine:corrinoid methyltransferase-like protein